MVMKVLLMHPLKVNKYTAKLKKIAPKDFMKIVILKIGVMQEV